MTESGAGNGTNLWSVPECPFQIAADLRVLDDIRLTVMDAFFSLPRGGAEIGGVLLGTYQPGRLTITDYAALECEHAFGPGFTLSPPDEARLTALLAKQGNGATGTRPVGWYHSHTRSGIFLSEADLEIHKRYFPEPWQVALVIKPHTFQPARIGFFFREADGSIRTEASYREIELAALPMQQVPGDVPSAPPLADLPINRYRPQAPAPGREDAALPRPAPEPEPVPEHPAAPSAELPVPQFLAANPPSSRRWLWILVTIGAGLGIGAAGFQARHEWLLKAIAVASPEPAAPVAPPSLGLTAIDREGQLLISWDRDSRALLRARDAVLEIADGAPPVQTIPLDRAHLQTGSFTYARQGTKVDVRLIVHQANGPEIREVTSFWGQLPERKPVEDPEVQKQRDELAQQAARLKTDLNVQAAKTKRLEKDLQSIREEIKQQQMKRMTNQLQDK
jgi:proteasome lid subunit RPN8/RPN11